MPSMIFSSALLFLVMVHKHILVISRYPIHLISQLVTACIAISVLLFASALFLTGGLHALSTQNVGYITRGLMTSGFLYFLLLSQTILVIGSGIRQEQYQGTLEAFYITPASRVLYLVSLLTQPLFLTALSTGCVWFIVSLVFGAVPMHNAVLSLITLVCTVSGIAGSSFCFAALTLLVKEPAQMIGSVVQIVLIVVCALFFPFHSLPTPLLVISHLLPLSYSVDLFRSALLGFPAGFPELAPPAVEVVIVVITGLLGPFVGYQIFCRVEHRARNDGTLLSY